MVHNSLKSRSDRPMSVLIMPQIVLYVFLKTVDIAVIRGGGCATVAVVRCCKYWSNETISVIFGPWQSRIVSYLLRALFHFLTLGRANK